MLKDICNYKNIVFSIVSIEIEKLNIKYANNYTGKNLKPQVIG